MATPSFKGSITTSGSSQAICVERAFFRNYPRFRKQAKVQAKVISDSQILITVVDEDSSAQLEDDPVVEAYLRFLAEDMRAHPERLVALSQAAMDRVQELTKDVVVNDNEVIPDDITF